MGRAKPVYTAATLRGPNRDILGDFLRYIGIFEDSRQIQPRTTTLQSGDPARTRIKPVRNPTDALTR